MGKKQRRTIMFKINEEIAKSIMQFVANEHDAGNAAAHVVAMGGCMDCSNHCAENCARKCKASKG